MTFKKGDRVRLKDHPPSSPRTEFVLQADEVGGLVWAANAGQSTPSPSTWIADAFELVPIVPQVDQIWHRKNTANTVKILNVCGQWVIYGICGPPLTQRPYNARKIGDFQEHFEPE